MATFLPGPACQCSQRGVERDPGTQQGRAGIERQIIGHAQHVIFVDDDPVGITAVGRRAFFVAAVVGPDRLHAAVLLQASLALRASAAGVNEAADAHFVTHLIFRDFVADRLTTPAIS